ncbi:MULTISPECIES: hypothetical protein [unclassified Streptomyces]|uniref:hypothetical protein n=1 Tax=unclassified Streptomyces TaxID=2593676 RepID=UPI002E2AF2A5|nr:MULTISPECIES: hypothetical protein [unclassified Streptomyces]
MSQHCDASDADSGRVVSVPHRLLRRQVRDIASGVEGELMAVVREEVSDDPVRERWVVLAYVRGPSGREISTAVANIEAV